VLEQRRDLVLVSSRNELRRWKRLFKILDDVVALDVHRTVMHQHRHQPARIDAEKPRLHIFVGHQVDGVRLPRNAFEVEEDAQLLRARRAHEVQHVHALPAEHLAGLDVAVGKLNHEALLPFSPIIGVARDCVSLVWRTCQTAVTGPPNRPKVWQ